DVLRSSLRIALSCNLVRASPDWEIFFIVKYIGLADGARDHCVCGVPGRYSPFISRPCRHYRQFEKKGHYLLHTKQQVLDEATILNLHIFVKPIAGVDELFKQQFTVSNLQQNNCRYICEK
ncbi:hypothetical protein AVEN_240904-1, partial [Araneus ventricosus]